MIPKDRENPNMPCIIFMGWFWTAMQRGSHDTTQYRRFNGRSIGPHFTGAYGHKVAKTPHIDALAARGMRFDAPIVISLCAPSRFSFMPGQLISRIAAYDNASEFHASTPTFAHYLKTLGYRTCLSGKCTLLVLIKSMVFRTVSPLISIPPILHGPPIGRPRMNALISGITTCKPSKKAVWPWPRSKPIMMMR